MTQTSFNVTFFVGRKNHVIGESLQLGGCVLRVNRMRAVNSWSSNSQNIKIHRNTTKIDKKRLKGILVHERGKENENF